MQKQMKLGQNGCKEHEMYESKTWIGISVFLHDRFLNETHGLL